MRNIGQRGPNGYNRNSLGRSTPFNYGAYNPNPHVGYNPNPHVGYNPNLHVGYNPNPHIGYNPNPPMFSRGPYPNFPRVSYPYFSGGFEPNHPGAYNGYPFKKGATDPVEKEFVRLAEAYFKDKFANVESALLAVKQLIGMLENAQSFLTKTFRFTVSTMETSEKYQATFMYIWKSLKLYKLFRWLYVKFLSVLGCQVPLRQEGDTIDTTAKTHEASYGLLAFLGVIFVAPYFISQWFESNAEGPMDPKYWKDAGYPVKVIRDFVADTPNKMTVRVNDKLILAPRILQSDMNLVDTEFVYATHNGRCGLVSVKYLAVDEPEQTQTTVVKDTTGNLEDQVDKSTDDNVLN